MKLYCSSCGHPNPYAAKKPNFCVNCGTNFATGEAIQQPVDSTVNEENLENLVEIEQDGFTTDNIDGLDVEIEGYNKTGITLGQVIDSAVHSPEEIDKPPAQKGKRKRISKKAQKETHEQVMKEFRKEAGPARRDKPDS